MYLKGLKTKAESIKTIWWKPQINKRELRTLRKEDPCSLCTYLRGTRFNISNTREAMDILVTYINEALLDTGSVSPEPDKHPAAMPMPCRKSLFDFMLGSGKAKKVVTFIEEVVNSSGSSMFPKTPPHSEDVLQSLYYYQGVTMGGNISDQNFSHPAHNPLYVGGWNT